VLRKKKGILIMHYMNCDKSELLFLGTGAADWTKPEPSGDFRGFSSVLVDGHILIDCSRAALQKMKELGISLCNVSDVFITHSHSDHFDLESILAIANSRKQSSDSLLTVHAEKSWASSILPGSFVLDPVEVEKPVKLADYTVLPLASNHKGDYEDETTVHYLFQKEHACWLYATDGAWMLNRTWQVLRKYKLDAWIVDCTIGDGNEGDYRIFEHNSLPMIRIMAETLFQQGVLKKDAEILLTHLARTLHPAHAQLVETLGPPFKVSYDGLVHTFSNII
jgi:phosphoribosyl 1,2-cyclic phosphate phosphodiesterase